MRKVFLKNRVRTLLLGLLISSTPAWAAYNDDPDCRAVSNGARAGADREIATIDKVMADTGSAIERSKSCVDDVLSGANRMINDFGGGAMSSQWTQALAKQACKVMSDAASTAQSRAQSSVQSQVPQALSQPVIQELSKPTAQPAPTSSPSLWQRLANTF